MNKDKILHILGKVTELSLYMLIFSIPFSKTMIEICITLAFFCWAIRKALTKDFKLKKTPLNSLFFIFFAVTILSFVNADLKLLFMRSLVSKCLKYIVLYFLIVETINSEIKFKNLLTMAIISSVIVMLDAYLQYYFIHVDVFRLYPPFKFAPLTDERGFSFLGYPTGPFPFPNDFSAWMLVIIMPTLSVFLWGIEKIYQKFILGIFLFPLLFLFYLAQARSAWLGFLASFFLMAFTQSKKLSAALLVLFLLFAVLIAVFSPSEKIDDITGFASIRDRIYMWRIGWKIFSEHPVIGNGLNMFFSKFRDYREDEFKYERGSYAHNGFLQMAAEIGILGLTVFILLIGGAFRHASRFIKETDSAFYKAFGLGLAGGILAFLIHSFFDTNLQSLPLVILFWFGTGLLMSLPCLKLEISNRV